jgi:DNA repair protein SbcC/Rad50
MIPLKVTMTGWMRYHDTQCADFTGARLLSICGENGAGKSSIFDAITYALFGVHRLGKQDVAELISEGKEQFSVEFEFEQEGRRYRVRRSRNRRPSPGSQGLWFWDESVNDWAAIAGTHQVAGLTRTLGALIRLTPGAFTSSFLLQQGAATEFLDVVPAKRFEVISSLVNLEAYQALEEKARRAQRSEAEEVRRLAEKLKQYEGVDAETLEILHLRLQQAGEQMRAAAKERDRAVALCAGAREYARLFAGVQDVTARIATADDLLAHAAAIEADAQRYAALDAALGTVSQVHDEIAAAAQADRAARRVRETLAALDLDARAATLDRAERLAAAAAAETERLMHEHEAVGQAERAAAEFRALADRVTDLRGRLREDEARLSAAADELERLPDLERGAADQRAIVAALPLLQELGRARARVERLRRDDPHAALAALTERQERLLAEREEIERAVEEAEAAVEEARRESAAARAEAKHLAEQLAQRREAAGEAVCSRCGQRIDPEQARRELQALAEQANAAQRRMKEATEATTAAQSRLSEARRRAGEHRELLQTALTGMQTAARQVADLDDAVADEADRVTRFREAAPDSLCGRVDGSTSAKQIAALLTELAATADNLRQVEQALRRLHGLQGEMRTVEQQVERLRRELRNAEREAGDRLAQVPRAAEAHAAAVRRREEAQQALAAARAVEARSREDEAKARAALIEAREQYGRLGAEAAAHEQASSVHHRAARTLAARLDDALRGQALADPAGTLRSLEGDRTRLAGAPSRLTELRTAQQERARLGGVLETIDAALSRIPEEHRVPEPEAQAALAAAETRLRETAEQKDRCERDLGKLERDLQEVELMRAALARSELRASRLKKLVDLLGKTGLQGALVGEALTTVMSHANAFLQRLTGGSLRLELERADGDALDLKAIDVTCMREPRSVHVLSGSQKFRCAVAIASGIGQYAGAGGMRSIVIDEGFGSLDQEGQHLIIEELKSLAEHMDRVIVVSHLDAFTNRDHFPDQIRVTTTGNGSRIERML